MQNKETKLENLAWVRVWSAVTGESTDLFIYMLFYEKLPNISINSRLVSDREYHRNLNLADCSNHA